MRAGPFKPPPHPRETQSVRVLVGIDEGWRAGKADERDMIASDARELRLSASPLAPVCPPRETRGFGEEKKKRERERERLSPILAQTTTHADRPLAFKKRDSSSLTSHYCRCFTAVAAFAGVDGTNYKGPSHQIHTHTDTHPQVLAHW